MKLFFHWNLPLCFVLSVGCGCTWWWQVTMEENTSTWWAVQFLTQQQATHCRRERPGKTHSRVQWLLVRAAHLCFPLYMMTASHGAHYSGCGDVNQLICFHKGNLLFYVDNEGKLHTLKQEVKQQQETQYALTNQKPNHQHILCNRTPLIFCLYILTFQ